MDVKKKKHTSRNKNVTFAKTTSVLLQNLLLKKNVVKF